ncbi:MAG: restriction endonuclease subunit S [Nanoarchaeota archaeon]|nr:restriction endonuclease subunit S [Nanoarchaeota archaeon]
MKLKQYPKYKDSGVQWIGEIPEGWSVKRLRFCAKICNGQDQKEVFDDDGSYPILGTGGEFGKSIKCLYNKPSVLLGRKGTIDKPQFIDVPFWTVDTLFYTKIDKSIIPKFFFYLSTQINFDYYSDTTAVPSMTQENLNNAPLTIPNKQTQTQIAYFLDSKTSQLNQTIEKDKKLIELLKEKRTALINHVVTKGINPKAKMKDSGIDWIGEIPEGWIVRRIDKLSTVSRGASPRPIDDPIYFDEDGEYSWVRIADVSASERYLRESSEKLSILGKSLSVPLEPGRLFVSIAGTVGKPIITKIKCCIHDGFVYFKNLKVNNEYLYYIFIGEQAYLGLGKWGTQLNLNTETIGLITIPLPDKKEQTQIIEYLDKTTSKIDKTIKKIEEKIILMEEYKKSLIHHVVTGKVDVLGAVA